MQQARQGLPITAARNQLMALVRECQTLVLVGETGSGKTTQLPQFILQAGLAQVPAGVCQSRLRQSTSAPDVIRPCKTRPILCRMHAGRVRCCDTAKARGSHSCRCARRQGDGGAAGCRGTALEFACSARCWRRPTYM